VISPGSNPHGLRIGGEPSRQVGLAGGQAACQGFLAGQRPLDLLDVLRRLAGDPLLVRQPAWPVRGQAGRASHPLNPSGRQERATSQGRRAAARAAGQREPVKAKLVREREHVGCLIGDSPAWFP
jgi:hypothetical protein